MKNQLPSNLLKKWLIRQVEGSAYEWFGGQQDTLAGDASARNLYMTLGMIPRRLGKGDLQLSIEDLERADGIRPGWNPKNWSVDVALEAVVNNFSLNQVECLDHYPVLR